jgi:hypothetical protein
MERRCRHRHQDGTGSADAWPASNHDSNEAYEHGQPVAGANLLAEDGRSQIDGDHLSESQVARGGLMENPSGDDDEGAHAQQVPNG